MQALAIDAFWGLRGGRGGRPVGGDQYGAAVGADQLPLGGEGVQVPPNRHVGDVEVLDKRSVLDRLRGIQEFQNRLLTLFSSHAHINHTL